MKAVCSSSSCGAGTAAALRAAAASASAAARTSGAYSSTTSTFLRRRCAVSGLAEHPPDDESVNISYYIHSSIPLVEQAFVCFECHIGQF